MRAMQQYEPEVLHATHAAGIDDAHVYVSHLHPEFVDGFRTSFTKSGLALQEAAAPEMPYLQKIGNGLYHPIPTAQAAYDYRERYTANPEQMTWRGGTTSTGYLLNVVRNPLVAFTEVPLLTADALRDGGPSGMSLGETILADVANEREIVASATRFYSALESRIQRSDSPAVGRLARSLKWWHQQGAPARLNAEEQASAAPDMAREATVSEMYSNVHRWSFYATLFLGEAQHLATLLGEPGMADEVAAEVAGRIAVIKAASPLHVSPLPQLAGAQALSTVNTLRHGKTLRQAR
jgi:hypothetical protein